MKMPKQKLYEPKGALRIERSLFYNIIKEEKLLSGKILLPKSFLFRS